VAVPGTAVAAVRVGERWVAFADECPHAGCALSSDGEPDGAVLICNCHGSEFDLATGAVVQGPAEGPLQLHPVRQTASGPEVLA